MSWQQYADENVRGGMLEFLILHLLTERDMYGYEIRQKLAERTNQMFDMQQGSLYGAFYRMENKKWITSYKKMGETNHQRMYYHIEQSGREYLDYGKKQFFKVFSGIVQLFNWEEQSHE